MEYWHRVKSAHIRSYSGPHFSLIWTEQGKILRISPYSVGMWENADQNNSEYGHFLRSDGIQMLNVNYPKIFCFEQMLRSEYVNYWSYSSFFPNLSNNSKNEKIVSSCLESESLQLSSVQDFPQKISFLKKALRTLQFLRQKTQYIPKRGFLGIKQLDYLSTTFNLKKFI